MQIYKRKREKGDYFMNGITVVSPMWGNREITDRMIFSVLH